MDGDSLTTRDKSDDRIRWRRFATLGHLCQQSFRTDNQNTRFRAAGDAGCLALADNVVLQAVQMPYGLKLKTGTCTAFLDAFGAHIPSILFTFGWG